MANWQTRRAQPARETKTMQQAKGEGHQPWLALCQSLRILVLSQDFICNEENAKGNDRFDRSRRYMHEAVPTRNSILARRPTALSAIEWTEYST